MRRIAALILITSCYSLLMADEVRTSDGSVLQGTVTVLTDETLTIETALFGTLSIPRGNINGLTVNEPTSVRLDDGSIWIGEISSSDATTLQINGTRGKTTVALQEVESLWSQDTEDPRETARQAEVDAQKRKWKTSLTLSAKGKSGNTRENNLSGEINAVLSGPDDELKLYGLYSRASTDGIKSSDERIGGVQYSYYVYDPYGMYIRTELEQDEFENIDLRTTVAGGLSYRWADEKTYKLSAKTGLSYRQESYLDGTADTGVMGLDFGLSHFYRFKNRWEISNEFTFTPAFEDFSNYLASQDSSLALPLGSSDWWKIKLGLRNDYNSQPGNARDKLDSTWYGALSITRE